MTRAPTYPIHRNRRNSISIRFSVRSIRFSRCGPRAARPSPSRLARAQRQGDTLPPSRARVKGRAALHRDSTTRRAGAGGGGRPLVGGAGKRGPPGDGRGPPPARRGRASRLPVYTRRGLNQLDELALADLQRRPGQSGGVDVVLLCGNGLAVDLDAAAIDESTRLTRTGSETRVCQ